MHGPISLHIFVPNRGSGYIYFTPVRGIIVKLNELCGFPILLKVTTWQCNQTHR